MLTEREFDQRRTELQYERTRLQDIKDNVVKNALELYRGIIEVSQETGADDEVIVNAAAAVTKKYLECTAI